MAENFFSSVAGMYKNEKEKDEEMIDEQQAISNKYKAIAGAPTFVRSSTGTLL